MVRLIGSIAVAAIIVALAYVYFKPGPGDAECDLAIASYFKTPSINVHTRGHAGDLITVAFDFVGSDGIKQAANSYNC
jgi:hypothetical protein